MKGKRKVNSEAEANINSGTNKNSPKLTPTYFALLPKQGQQIRISANQWQIKPDRLVEKHTIKEVFSAITSCEKPNPHQVLKKLNTLYPQKSIGVSKLAHYINSLGYTFEEIKKMTPAEARETFNTEFPPDGFTRPIETLKIDLDYVDTDTLLEILNQAKIISKASNFFNWSEPTLANYLTQRNIISVDGRYCQFPYEPNNGIKAQQLSVLPSEDALTSQQPSYVAPAKMEIETTSLGQTFSSPFAPGLTSTSMSNLRQPNVEVMPEPTYRSPFAEQPMGLGLFSLTEFRGSIDNNNFDYTSLSLLFSHPEPEEKEGMDTTFPQSPSQKDNFKIKE